MAPWSIGVEKMRDKTVVEPMGLPEIFVDGFSSHVTRNGIMTCVGYRLQDGLGEELRVAVVRLIWPEHSTDEAIADAREAQYAPNAVPPSGRAGRH